MSRRKLIEYIRSPQLVEELELRQLDEWIREYPYVSSLHVLRAIKLKMEGHKDAQKAMYTAAMYSPDLRKLNSNLSAFKGKEIRDTTQQEENESEEISGSNELEVDTFRDARSNGIEAEETGTVERKDFTALEETGDSSGANLISDPSVDNEHEVSEPESIEMAAVEEISEVQDKITDRAISGLLEDEEEELTEADILELPEEDSVQLGLEERSENELDLLEESEDVSLVHQETESTAESENQIHFQPHGSSDNYQLSEFSRWLLELDESGKVERKDLKEPELHSQALAELLVSQGHIKKAIDMYQKLILANPEKSSFFAAQIKKLKAL